MSQQVDEMKAVMASFCKEVMRNKSQVFASLMMDMTKMRQLANGLNGMAQTIEQGSDANLRKQLKNTMVSVRDLCDSQNRLLSLIVIYLVAGSATTDAARAAMDFGADGQDIVSELLRQKMQGR